jgi:hypothetical protein
MWIEDVLELERMLAVLEASRFKADLDGIPDSIVGIGERFWDRNE